MGGLFPETSESFLRAQHDSPSRSDKSWPLAGARGNLGVDAAERQMGSFPGPVGGAARQAVTAATGLGPNLSDADHAAWVARRGAKKKMSKKDGVGVTRREAGGVKRGSKRLSGIYLRQGGGHYP